MKKSIIISCFMMMVGFLGISHAQDVGKEITVLTAEQQQAIDEVIAMDPKLSAEEIEQLKIAVLGAPANAVPAIDPKEDNPPEVVAAPLNAEPIEEREAVLALPTSPSSATAIQSGTQADGGKAENVINLHSLSIPGAVQLEAPKSEWVAPKHNTANQGVNPQAEPNGN
jgi:hypothetical protein